MPFVRLKGLPGKFYVPESASESRKHPCRDCFHCQMCSDTRCAACRRSGDDAVDARRAGSKQP